MSRPKVHKQCYNGAVRYLLIGSDTMTHTPLAYKIRPKTLDEIAGQAHLVGGNGVIRKMIEREKFFSLVLYGPPGIGKTTIANVIGEAYGLNTFTFNASTDSKATLKDIVSQAKHYGALVIVDEIHRMKKDIQDFLLPHVETGSVVMIGLTTNNPYHSVNPAIRSRCHVLKLKNISNEELKMFLEKVIENHPDDLSANFNDDVLMYIARVSNRDIRTAINMLELLQMAYPQQPITLQKAEHTIQHPALSLDKNEDNYYNILSALQKSIRGSDVDASLHYLARLVVMEDLPSILRRLSVIAFEDVGLANPAIYPRMEAAANTAHRVGFPEARIPLANIVVEMALSPKSNSAYKALDKAIADIQGGATYTVPNHLINVENFETKDTYHYPHDYDNHIVTQQYMPEELRSTRYYTPANTSKYERALGERLEKIQEILKKTND